VLVGIDTDRHNVIIFRQVNPNESSPALIGETRGSNDWSWWYLSLATGRGSAIAELA